MVPRQASIFLPTQDQEEGLGFIGTAISVGTSILSAGIGAIRQAVHKAREKRREYARRMEPLNDEEQGAIIAQVVGVSKHRAFDQAIPEVLQFIREVRPGRSGFILQPNVDTGSKKAGQDVNEYAALKRVFRQVRTAYLQQEQQARAQLRISTEQSKKRNDLVIVGASVLGGLLLLGALWYLSD